MHDLLWVSSKFCRFEISGQVIHSLSAHSMFPLLVEQAVQKNEINVSAPTWEELSKKLPSNGRFPSD